MCQVRKLVMVSDNPVSSSNNNIWSKQLSVIIDICTSNKYWLLLLLSPDLSTLGYRSLPILSTFFYPPQSLRGPTCSHPAFFYDQPIFYEFPQASPLHCSLSGLQCGLLPFFGVFRCDYRHHTKIKHVLFKIYRKSRDIRINLSSPKAVQKRHILLVISEEWFYLSSWILWPK